MVRIFYINTVASAQKTVKRILCLDTPIIGISFKGINLGKKGDITVVTISTPSRDVYVFDIKKDPNIMYDGGLIRVIQSVELVKAIHDCSRASAVLHFKYNITLKNYFDTQVVFSVILETQGLPPRMISLDALCDRFNIDRFITEPDIRTKMKEDINYWGQRPLTKEMMNSLASEVLPLVPDIYFTLQENIDETMYDWLDCKSEEHRVMFISPKKVTSIKCKRWEAAIKDRTTMFRNSKEILNKKNVKLIRNTTPEIRYVANRS